MSKIILGFMLLAAAVMPAIVMAIFKTSSMGVGVSIIAVFYIYLSMASGLHKFVFKKIKIAPLFLALFISLIFAQCLTAYQNANVFDFSRYWQSLIALIICIIGSFSFVNLIKTFTKKNIDSAVRLAFFFLLASGLMGVMKLSPFYADAASKAVFFFSEPSHFALSFLPFYLYMVVRSKLAIRFLYIFLGLSMAMALENLTLLVGVVMIVFITTTIQSIVFFLPFLVAAPLLFDLNYYLDRLNFIEDSQNLSVMVYMQGWQVSYLDFIKTFGLGVGFQQFGIVGDVGDMSDKIIMMAGERLNAFDGGSVASKFIGEFGFLGLIIILIYVFYCFYFIIKLRRCLLLHESSIDVLIIFGYSCFIMYSIDLFVRGVGYFSSSGFLFFTSIVLIISGDKFSFSSNNFLKHICFYIKCKN